jgi:catechol 2,3-dioxygenase-like lactoylglutathione lyase family enzyme
MKIGGIVQAALGVADMARAVEFYRDVVGLPLTFTTAGMTFFDAGNVRLLLGPLQPGQTPGGDAVLYFDAPEFDAACAALEARGVTFLRPAADVIQRDGAREHCLRFFKDPDGHTLCLMGWR